MINRSIYIGLILPVSITIIEKTFSTIKIIKIIVINKLNGQWVYIEKYNINLFSKHSIMDKIGFLNYILSKILNSYCQFLSFVVALISLHISKSYYDFCPELINLRIKFVFNHYNTFNF